MEPDIEDPDISSLQGKSSIAFGPLLLLPLHAWYFLLVSLRKELRQQPVSDMLTVCFLSVSISLLPSGLGQGWDWLHCALHSQGNTSLVGAKPVETQSLGRNTSLLPHQNYGCALYETNRNF